MEKWQWNIFVLISAKIEDEYFFGQQNGFSVFTKAPPQGSSYFDFQDDLLGLSAAVNDNKYVAPYPRAKNWWVGLFDEQVIQYWWWVRL